MCLTHIDFLCLCIFVEKSAFLTQEKGFLGFTLATTMRGRFVVSDKSLRLEETVLIILRDSWNARGQRTPFHL